MIRPLLVAVAHGTDLVSFLLALSLFGIQGEGNWLMRSAFSQWGPLGIVGLKASGTIALACISQLRPRYLVPAAGSGIVGSVVNLVAVAL